jgi:iron complex outermembrane recepter protein
LHLDATSEGTATGHANQVSLQRDSNTPFDGASVVNANNINPGVFARPKPTVPELRTLARQVALSARTASTSRRVCRQ